MSFSYSRHINYVPPRSHRHQSISLQYRSGRPGDARILWKGMNIAPSTPVAKPYIDTNWFQFLHSQLESLFARDRADTWTQAPGLIMFSTSISIGRQ
jgi:hypothetical protein